MGVSPGGGLGAHASFTTGCQDAGAPVFPTGDATRSGNGTPRSRPRRSYCGSPRFLGSASTSLTAQRPELLSAMKMWPL